MQVESFLEQSARRHPQKTALVCGNTRLSYSELEGRANRLAHALIAQGVERGDRVAVYLGNSVEAVVSVLAIFKAGAAFMMLNPTMKAEKLVHLIAHAQARALILPARRLASLGDLRIGLAHLKALISVRPGPAAQYAVSLDDLLARHRGDTDPPPKRAIDMDLAALVYTSGSTGVPKGVMLTHANIVAATDAIAEYLHNSPDDVILNVLSLSFGYGLTQLFTALKAGATLVLEPSFAYPQSIIQSLVREKVTGFAMVPTISAILLQMDLAKHDFSHLRYLTNAGAAMPTEHIRQLRRLLPHVQIYSMYGLTECTRASYLPPEEVDRRPTSVGRGMPNAEVYVIDEQGRRVGPEVVGELVVRGAHVMRGYWELPEETDRALRPGHLPGERVLLSGDLFRTDIDGYLYFVGRKDDIIKSRGEKVSPREVENALYSHPGIVEAAVVGVPDDVLGQAIKAVVVLKSGWHLTDRDVLRHCAERLEDFMVPQVVEFRESLPKTDNGKINKRELCEVIP